MFIFCCSLVIIVICLFLYYISFRSQTNNNSYQITKYHENTRIIYTDPEIIYDDPLEDLIINEIEEIICNSDDSYDE